MSGDIGVDAGDPAQHRRERESVMFRRDAR
jgi:hypothetical protein